MSSIQRLKTRLLLCAILMTASAASAQVRVRHMEGTVHGFLVLRTLDGKVIANGDLTQVPKGNQLTSKIVFHFHDGSK